MTAPPEPFKRICSISIVKYPISHLVQLPWFLRGDDNAVSGVPFRSSSVSDERFLRIVDQQEDSQQHGSPECHRVGRPSAAHQARFTEALRQLAN